MFSVILHFYFLQFKSKMVSLLYFKPRYTGRRGFHRSGPPKTKVGHMWPTMSQINPVLAGRSRWLPVCSNERHQTGRPRFYSWREVSLVTSTFGCAGCRWELSERNDQGARSALWRGSDHRGLCLHELPAEAQRYPVTSRCVTCQGPRRKPTHVQPLGAAQTWFPAAGGNSSRARRWGRVTPSTRRRLPGRAMKNTHAIFICGLHLSFIFLFPCSCLPFFPSCTSSPSHSPSTHTQILWNVIKLH